MMSSNAYAAPSTRPNTDAGLGDSTAVISHRPADGKLKAYSDPC